MWSCEYSKMKLERYFRKVIEESVFRNNLQARFHGSAILAIFKSIIWKAFFFNVSEIERTCCKLKFMHFSSNFCFELWIPNTIKVPGPRPDLLSSNKNQSFTDTWVHVLNKFIFQGKYTNMYKTVFSVHNHSQRIIGCTHACKACLGKKKIRRSWKYVLEVKKVDDFDITCVRCIFLEF